MASDRSKPHDYAQPLRRILVGGLVLVLFGLFLLWRIDSPRVERLRTGLVDAVIPAFDWVLAPVTAAAGLAEGFHSYAQLARQNQELRRELRQMRAWREAAIQLEQENAKLLDLNKVRLDPALTHVTGVVLADAGSPFRQSVLLNVGARDGIIDGWAVTDGLGLVGRIAGVGARTARVILLGDPSSRLPVTLLPSGQRAILAGDGSLRPLLDFVEVPEAVQAGDRVVSSGDGGLFPAGLLVGNVAIGPEERLRVRLAADFERLEFLRVLRSHGREAVEGAGALVAPEPPRAEMRP